MEILHLRNATIKLNYGGLTFLIDPYFAELHSEPSMGGKSKNPTSALPIQISKIIHHVDFVIISHLHPDHFDRLAQQKIPKDQAIICQPGDQKSIQSMGFTQVIPMQEKMILGKTSIYQTSGAHGFGKMAEIMGPVSGLVFQNETEFTLYWLGDTVFGEEVKNQINRFDPQLLICHAGGNKFFKTFDFLGLGLKEDTSPLIMDSKQLEELIRFAPKCKIIATHLNALDHETESKESLERMLAENGFPADRIYIPQNGERLHF